ncbi:MAG: hypothetical protein QM710_09230 [Flavobacterium sp.]
MGTVIHKSKIYQWLFVLCVVIPYFDNFELTIAVWTLATLFSLQKTYSIGIIRQVACFTTILGLALLVSCFKNHQLYFVIRDVTYMIKPILGLLIGYQLCKKIKTNIFELIVRTGFIFSLVHYFFVLKAVIFFKVLDINGLRYYGGYFSDFEVFALVIILFHKRFEIAIAPQRRIIYILAIGASVALYLARTNFIEFALLLMGLKGFLEINRRNMTVLAVLVALTIIGYSTILMINPKRNGPGLEAFLYKIKIIPQEAFKTKVNIANWRDLNDNYRSYENIMTVKQVTHNGAGAVAFGEGMGSKVDLKQSMMLGDMELRFISILHNGYMTVFLKSGLVGILFLLLSFGIYFRKSRSEIPIVKQIDLLFIGTGVFMIMSYWVFMGFYFKADNKSILVGMLLCIREIIIKSKARQND